MSLAGLSGTGRVVQGLTAQSEHSTSASSTILPCGFWGRGFSPRHALGGAGCAGRSFLQMTANPPPWRDAPVPVRLFARGTSGEEGELWAAWSFRDSQRFAEQLKPDVRAPVGACGCTGGAR